RELALLGVPRSQMTLVPSGVNLERFRPDGPAEPRSDRPRILSVGRLGERKGFEGLIRAMPTVPRADCVIVGGQPDEPYARKLRALAERCRVADRVRLAGAVSTQ